MLNNKYINGANIIDINYGWYFNKVGRITKIYKVIKLIARITQIAINDRFISLKNIISWYENIQGKCIINSISLKDGNELFSIAQTIRMYGCIPVTVVLDETGQTTSLEHRLIICKRAHSILTKLVGFQRRNNIWFNSSSRPEHVRSIKLISCLFPNANFISTNLSSSNSKELYLYNIEKFSDLNMGIILNDVVQGQGIQLNYKNINTEVLDTCSH